MPQTTECRADVGVRQCDDASGKGERLLLLGSSATLRHLKELIMRAIEKARALADREQIDLLRGGCVVSSFAGSFGGGLRETRLTAMLGYLIALEPEPFCDILSFPGKPLRVSLGTRHASDRSDILVETTTGRGVIEAKVDGVDPFRQTLKYPARWRVLLTEHAPSKKRRRLRGVKYLRWRDFLELLQKLARLPDNRVRFVSRDMLSYLEEHALVKTDKSVEIYAREINNEETLALFLKAQMYGCRYQKGSRLAEALYFAPHFGQRIARRHPGVRVGISYIARIERVEVLETWEDLLQGVQEVGGKPWLNGHMKHLEPIRRRWIWTDKRRSFLFLSEPRLVFNPPVLKGNLQEGHGWLSKRFLSFDELFAAWGC